MKIKHAKDFWSGLMFAGLGLGFAVIAQNYDMGNPVEMIVASRGGRVGV